MKCCCERKKMRQCNFSPNGWIPIGVNQSRRLSAFSRQRVRKLQSWRTSLLRSATATFVLIVQYSFRVIFYSFEIKIELTKPVIGFGKFVSSSLDSFDILFAALILELNCFCFQVVFNRLSTTLWYSSNMDCYSFELVKIFSLNHLNWTKIVRIWFKLKSPWV